MLFDFNALDERLNDFVPYANSVIWWLALVFDAAGQGMSYELRHKCIPFYRSTNLCLCVRERILLNEMIYYYSSSTHTHTQHEFIFRIMAIIYCNTFTQTQAHTHRARHGVPLLHTNTRSRCETRLTRIRWYLISNRIAFSRSFSLSVLCPFNTNHINSYKRDLHRADPWLFNWRLATVSERIVRANCARQQKIVFSNKNELRTTMAMAANLQLNLFMCGYNDRMLVDARRFSKTNFVLLLFSFWFD